MLARRHLTIPAFQIRVAVGIIVFLGVVFGTWLHWPAAERGDLTSAFCGAEHLLSGTDPYSCNLNFQGRSWPSNPLTTVLVAASFLAAGPYAGHILFAFSCGLLAFAATREGKWWRLLLFVSLPFVQSFTLLQWAPFMLAIYFLPDLLPLSLAKPQLALPIILTRFNRWRIYGLIAFAGLTLLLDPTWPLRWWPQAQSYDGFIPLLRLPLGPLLLLSLLRRRDPRALFLFVMAATPKRLYYDNLLLWAIPSTRLEMLAFTVINWLLLILPMDLGDWIVLVSYLPALAIVLKPIYASGKSLVTQS